jgi:hypothetical protein
MSGGHFDYGCFRISRFADELKHEIDMNHSHDEEVHGYNFDPETITLLKKCHDVIEYAGKLAKEIEWLYSGDHGEDSFIKAISKIKPNI